MEATVRLDALVVLAASSDFDVYMKVLLPQDGVVKLTLWSSGRTHQSCYNLLLVLSRLGSIWLAVHPSVGLVLSSPRLSLSNCAHLWMMPLDLGPSILAD